MGTLCVRKDQRFYLFGELAATATIDVVDEQDPQRFIRNFVFHGKFAQCPYATMTLIYAEINRTIVVTPDE